MNQQDRKIEKEIDSMDKEINRQIKIMQEDFNDDRSKKVIRAEIEADIKAWEKYKDESKVDI